MNAAAAGPPIFASHPTDPWQPKNGLFPSQKSLNEENIRQLIQEYQRAVYEAEKARKTDEHKNFDYAIASFEKLITIQNSLRHLEMLTQFGSRGTTPQILDLR